MVWKGAYFLFPCVCSVYQYWSHWSFTMRLLLCAWISLLVSETCFSKDLNDFSASCHLLLTFKGNLLEARSPCSVVPQQKSLLTPDQSGFLIKQAQVTQPPACFPPQGSSLALPRTRSYVSSQIILGGCYRCYIDIVWMQHFCVC